MNQLACPCDEVIMKSENGMTKIRSKIIVVRGNRVYAVCKSCNSEVRVPLTPELIAGPPLILSK